MARAMTQALKTLSARRLSAGRSDCSGLKYPTILTQPPTITPNCLQKPDNSVGLQVGALLRPKSDICNTLISGCLRERCGIYEAGLIWARRVETAESRLEYRIFLMFRCSYPVPRGSITEKCNCIRMRQSHKQCADLDGSSESLDFWLGRG